MSVSEMPGTIPPARLDVVLRARNSVREFADTDVLHSDDGRRDGPYRLHRRLGARRAQSGSRVEGLPSSAIHELRTPLTSIHGYAQILQRSMTDNPRASNALAVILRESSRLGQMLAELSDVADLTTDANGRISTTTGTADVHDLVDELVESIALHDKSSHPISIAGSAKIECDVHRVSLALCSVLSNAVLYSPDDTQVAVTIDESSDRVRIWIADRGIGVEDEDNTRIYEAFERGQNARKFGVRGLGLGLFIARRAIALEGGEISHEARPDGGTVFLVELPRR